MGRVKNALTNSMVNSYRSCRHYSVSLHDFVGVTRKNVRFLVAEAFMTKPNGFYTLYHKSGDVRDNSVENLGWQKGLPRGYMKGAKNAKKAAQAKVDFKKPKVKLGKKIAPANQTKAPLRHKPPTELLLASGGVQVSRDQYGCPGLTS